jgi:hypothetical protein
VAAATNPAYSSPTSAHPIHTANLSTQPNPHATLNPSTQHNIANSPQPAAPLPTPRASPKFCGMFDTPIPRVLLFVLTPVQDG